MAFLIQAGHCPGFLFFVALGEFVGRCDGAGQSHEGGGIKSLDIF